MVAQSLKGVTQGTALAVILNDQALAFHPRRLPDGSVELTVIAADEPGGTWPVGWPRQQDPYPTAPALFDIKVIELEDDPLDGILEAAAEVIGIPILIDRPALEARDIDLAQDFEIAEALAEPVEGECGGHRVSQFLVHFTAAAAPSPLRGREVNPASTARECVPTA